MRLKQGVRIQGIRPELLLAILIADRAYTAKGGVLVITSICDGKHSATSLHYTGCAFDCRTKSISKEQATMIMSYLKGALPNDFDIVLESTHIHIEYQPRF